MCVLFPQLSFAKKLWLLEALDGMISDLNIYMDMESSWLYRVRILSYTLPYEDNDSKSLPSNLVDVSTK